MACDPWEGLQVDVAWIYRAFQRDCPLKFLFTVDSQRPCPEVASLYAAIFVHRVTPTEAAWIHSRPPRIREACWPWKSQEGNKLCLPVSLSPFRKPMTSFCAILALNRSWLYSRTRVPILVICDVESRNLVLDPISNQSPFLPKNITSRGGTSSCKVHPRVNHCQLVEQRSWFIGWSVDWV